MKYKVLVADDEYIIRRGIIKLLHKYSDFDVVSEAEDGEQALELVENQEIDVFFVDINMPFLNGLQFIEKLRELQPKALVNIITGYDKFEYVRQALSLGVFEYILKPLNEEVFDESMNKILNSLKKKNEEERYLNWIKSTFDKNKANFTGEFLEKCLLLQYSPDKIKDEIEYLDLDIPKSFIMTLIAVERIDNQDIRKHWNDSLLYSSAENIAKDFYHSLEPLYISRINKGYFLLISKSEEKSSLEKLNQEYKSAVEKYIPAKVIMIQYSDTEPSHLPLIYKELTQRMEEVKGYPSIIKKMKQFIELNYYKEELSLNDASDYVNLSPQHLSRIFKKEMDITFIDYLTKIRIKKAIELFEDDSIKMYEIAERIGYSSQHYFSSVFKKVIGVSPVEYRNQWKVHKNENLSN